MRVFLNFFVPLLLLFPAFASALNIEGPSHSSDGSFSISWQPIDNSLSCHGLKISVISNRGYEEYFNLSVDQITYDFYELPSGVYTLVLSGVCDTHSSAGDWNEVFFGSMALIVGHEAQSKYQSASAELRTKSVVSEAQATSAIASTADLGWRCNIYCPVGTHSTEKVCRDQVDLVNGNSEVCRPCTSFQSANAAFCVTNTDEFWTCDECPSDYNTVQTFFALPGDNRYQVCPGGKQNRCEINTSPPAAVTLSGSTARQDATIAVSWSSVRHANYYQWKFITQSSWTRIDATQLTVSNLTSDQYSVQVRACSNDFGCGALSSIAIALSAPDAPIITSNSPSPAGSFSLNWTRSSSASKYMWKRDSENWQDITGQQVLVNLISGTYTFYVRACNAVECGEIASKSIILMPPASPTITSSSTNYLQVYPMKWSSITNASYYEWRINSGSWVRASANLASVSNLPFGSSTLYVRACTSVECGQPGSRVVNNTYNLSSPIVVIARYQYVNPSCQWNYAGGGGGTTSSVLICGGEAAKNIASKTTGGGKCSYSVRSGYTVTNPTSCTEYQIKGRVTW